MIFHSLSKPLALLLPLLFAGCASDDSEALFYYQTYQGTNHQAAGWKQAPSRAAFEEQGIETFDSFTLIRNGDGTTEVQREYASPSGDWVVYLRYFYGTDGRLSKVFSEIHTATALKTKTGRSATTKCVRHYQVEGAL